MKAKLRVMTVLGTRPEIIRLSSTLKRLDRFTHHTLVHTGQNYDYELNQVFFDDFGLRKPDHFLAADTESLGSVLGSILHKLEKVILSDEPDALLILGDTNSSISAVIAKRLKVPVFHMEAGNRSFDENVPEETNRRLVDHVADYNLVYTEHARRNLLAEGIHPSRVILTGSPMREVLDANSTAIRGSDVLKRQGLSKNGYFLVSLHREENVDCPVRLAMALRALNAVADEYQLPVLVSTHPRTRNQLEHQEDSHKRNIIFHRPFGFHDYVKLQTEARLVLSDSGTISEESALLGFPAITLRDFIERPEALDNRNIITSGLIVRHVLNCVELTLEQAREPAGAIPEGYGITDTSSRVVSFLHSATHSHPGRLGLRRTAVGNCCAGQDDGRHD